MERYTLYRGLLVMHDGVLARVEKVNPKWTIVQHEDGTRFNAYPGRLVEAPEGSVFTIDEAEDLQLADPVRFIGRSSPDNEIYVVLGISGTTYKIARLGKSNNRFFRSVAASELARVPDEDVHL